MTSMAAPQGFSMRLPVVGSLALHLLAAAAFILARPSLPPPRAPTYHVNLVAAPPGPPQVGVVQATPPTAVPSPTPVPKVRGMPEPERMAPAPIPAKARPTPPKIATPNAAPPAPTPPAPPVAAGGVTGGAGADVANVKVDGPEFPFPVYLQNVVRQIALQFRPSSKGALQAEVAFMIRRDGTIAGLRLTRRSSVFSFDQDALAAVEVASHRFGPLPQGFSDDVLPVIFSFDPRLIR